MFVYSWAIETIALFLFIMWNKQQKKSEWFSPSRIRAWGFLLTVSAQKNSGLWRIPRGHGLACLCSHTHTHTRTHTLRTVGQKKTSPEEVAAYLQAMVKSSCNHGNLKTSKSAALQSHKARLSVFMWGLSKRGLRSAAAATPGNLWGKHILEPTPDLLSKKSGEIGPSIL